MKKKFIAILAIALAAMSVFAFTACTDDPPVAKEDGSFVVSVGIPSAATLDFELAEIAWSTEK